MRGCFETVDTRVFVSQSGDEQVKVGSRKAKRKRQIQGRTKAVSRGCTFGGDKVVVKEARKLRRKRQ